MISKRCGHSRAPFLPAALALAFLTGCGWFGSNTVRFARGEGPVDDVIALLSKPGTGLEVLKAPDKGSEKSCTGLECLTKGKADLAIAFSHDEEREKVRTLIPLYNHYLFMVVGSNSTTSRITDVRSMKGRKVGAGPRGSGTWKLFRLLLKHYGLTVEANQPLIYSKKFSWTTKNGKKKESPVECRGSGSTPIICTGKFRALRVAFEKGWLDVYANLGTSYSKGVEQTLNVPGSRLLSLDLDPDLMLSAMEGIHASQPFLVGSVLPRHVFKDRPARPVGVIGSRALLVARADLSSNVAWKVTRAVFEYKHTLSDKNPQLRNISERFDRDSLIYPLHAGAEMYYRRDEPTFMQKWAESISLGIALMAGLWSGLMGLWAWRRRKKRDVLGRLYEEFHQIIGMYDEKHETPLDQMSETKLEDIHDRLIELRRKAFMAALSGETEMSQKYAVFQDFLLFELGSVEGLLQKKRR
ncbi:MAG: hypothetical protein GXP54_08335 [Deltaproteobacteria bacterium]|nr:hypothetical protein [Deltaproteobacteria bacterium]